MFCSNCGNELRQGLKYCNRCGAQTTEALEKTAASSSSQKTAQTLSEAISWIGVAGIVALAILIGNLLRRDDISPPHFLLVLVFAAMILGIVFAIVRQISVLSGKPFPFAVKENETFSSRENLPRVESVPQLESFRQPIGSVIENTTRTLDEVRARKTEN